MTDSKKGKRKSVRQQRWAMIVAGVLAFGMLISSAAMGLGFLSRNGEADPAQDWDLESYLEQYRHNAALMEEYLEEYGPTVPVLENLAEHYSYIIMLLQLLEDTGEAPGEVGEYQAKLIGVFRGLIELEPGEPRHHLGLLDVYRETGVDEAVIVEQVAALQELLRKEPAPAVSLTLLGYLQYFGLEDLINEEAALLRHYLEEQLSGGTMDNLNRYYYAYLLAEHLAEPEAALEQLELILDSEPEDSELYQHVKSYRDRLSPEEGEPGSGENSDQ